MNHNNNSKGFTIIELLIVIVIIGILVAITAVSYTGVTNGANTADAQTKARAVKQYVIGCQATTGTYPGVTGTAPAGRIVCNPAIGLTMPTIDIVIPTADTDAAASTAIGAANQKTRIAYLQSSGKVWYWDSTASPAGAKAL